MNCAKSVPFITDKASVSEHLILATSVCLHLPKYPDVNECIVLDWMQLLLYGQKCLNKHGVLPTQQIWKKTRPSKPHSPEKTKTSESSLEVPQMSLSFRKHKHGANTTIRITKKLIKRKLFNNKQIILQHPWSTSNFSDCGHQRRLPWGINTLHAKLSNCECMWSFTFKVCYTYIMHPKQRE
jgi:hypothetical protein